ncbi:MAG: shikimate dehydrogenase [Sandarakinorhabdus sp.]|nr:shikimate dehydrogenase [Sandarakinorhabdus sp.]
MPLPYAEVIGDPVTQSKSPLIHGFWLKKLGLRGDYRATRVRANGLADYLAKRRTDPDWRGCNVTIPHKQAVIELIDAPLRTAVRIGAANCIYRNRNGLSGENSDIDGVREALAITSEERDPGITCLIGAGGAARAAMQALDSAGVEDLRLLVRRPERGQELLDHFGMAGKIHRFVDAAEAMAGAHTIINASPLGMTGQGRMPASMLEGLDAAAPGALVFDMVYAPLETDLLVAARARGLRPVDGLTMLIGQADLAFTLFFHAPAPREHDAELRALLTA